MPFQDDHQVALRLTLETQLNYLLCSVANADKWRVVITGYVVGLDPV